MINRPGIPTKSDTNRSRKPANHTDLRVFCFISYQETPINIKEDVSNCVSDFSFLNLLTDNDITS